MGKGKPNITISRTLGNLPQCARLLEVYEISIDFFSLLSKDFQPNPETKQLRENSDLTMLETERKYCLVLPLALPGTQ